MMNKTIKKVENYIRQYKMIEKNDTVVAGVSGGADSVCLLFVLCSLRKEIGFRVVVCHVNHGLRGEAADRDERYVEELCRRMEVPYHAFHENVELFSKKRKQSLEEAGRIVRRQAFETVCRQAGGNKIATAHHSDDNAETVLMNLARGTGLRGLCGIRPINGDWIRPLLCLTRQEIETLLEEQKLSFCTDATNAEDEYTRNRIRHNILPVLEEQVNRRTVKHLNELSSQAEEIWKYMQSQAEKAWDNCVHLEENGETEEVKVRIDQETFEKVPEAVKKFLILKCIRKAAGAEKDIETVHVNAVLDLFSTQTGKSRNLPYRVKAERTYQGVLLRKLSDREKVKNNRIDEENSAECMKIEIKIPGITHLPFTGQKICCTICDAEEENSAKVIPQKSYTKCFDYDIIKSSLYARYRRPGDYLTIDSKGSRKKLKSYFIDEKISREEREKKLLIAENSHVVWIPGMRMSSYYQVGDQTSRILKIKIMEE